MQFHNENSYNPRVCIIAARANDLVVSRLVSGCQEVLRKENILPEHQSFFQVAGALEIPLMLKKCALQMHFDFYIVLGAVIKGQSDHYQHVCRMANDGVQSIAIEHELALGNGILTVHNLEQALARADGPAGNLGKDAALAAFDLYKQFNAIQKQKKLSL